MLHYPASILALLISSSIHTAQVTAAKEIRDLGWMVGTWSGSGKVSFGGRQMEIATTMMVSFDGHFLKTVSEDKSSGFTMTKTTMTGWDARKHQFVSYTFTNISPSARIAYGKMEGDKLTMVSEPWEAEGMTAVMRETIKKATDTQIAYSLETRRGENWSQGMNFILSKK